MKKTTILTIMCLALMSCQKPCTFSEAEMKAKDDIIASQKIMLDNLMHNCNSAVSELQARNVVAADAYEYTVKGVRDSLSITVNKDYLNATILIKDAEKEIIVSWGNGRVRVNEIKK